MPRSASDGGGNTGLFRTVFARSPLGQSTSSDDSLPNISSSNSRASSWTSNHKTGKVQHTRAGSDQDHERPIIHHARQRSYSHRERKRPSLSMSKLSLQLSTDILSQSPTSPIVDANEVSSTNWEDSFGRILHHGEAQTSHSGWRKKYEYLVLTEYYLFRFKSSKKASEMFPWILPAKAHMYRPESAASVTSIQDVEPSSGNEIDSPTEISAAKSTSIYLQDIIATQFISDNRIRVGIEIIRQSQTHKGLSTLAIFVERLGGQPHWIESINVAAQNAQVKRGNSLSSSFVQLLRDTVGEDVSEALDTPANRVFIVHRRQSQLNENTASGLEEISKDHHAMVFLLIGKYMAHLVTVPKSHRGSNKSLSEYSKIHVSSYGIVNLICMSVNERDDSFDLIFRYGCTIILYFDFPRAD
jgi:hypothetical protein